MPRTEDLRKQNDELVRSLKRIGFKLRLGSPHNAAALYSELAEIAKKFDQHFHQEEQEIYPVLDHAKSMAVRQISKASHRELGDLDHRILTFLQRWPNGAGVENQHEAFTHEASALVAAVQRALSEELAHLLPAAERVH